MKFEGNRKFSKDSINARGTTLALARRAYQLAPQIKAGTSRKTGYTAGTTHVETGHRSASGDRPAVRIVQGGASVPLNFRLRRDEMVRALGGGA